MHIFIGLKILQFYEATTKFPLQNKEKIQK